MRDAYDTQGINFVGSENNIAVNSGAQRVAVNCGSGSCTGKFIPYALHHKELYSPGLYDTGSWDWSALKVTGGTAGPITNFNGIENFSQ